MKKISLLFLILTMPCPAQNSRPVFTVEAGSLFNVVGPKAHVNIYSAWLGGGPMTFDSKSGVNWYGTAAMTTAAGFSIGLGFKTNSFDTDRHQKIKSNRLGVEGLYDLLSTTSTPFIGLTLGLYWLDYSMPTYTPESSSIIHPGIAPAVGFKANLGDTGSLILSAEYNIVGSSKHVLDGTDGFSGTAYATVKPQSLNVTLGLKYGFRL